MSANLLCDQMDQAYPFLIEMAEIRRRARQHIAGGAATLNAAADRQLVIRLLNEALAAELVCVLRYKRHHFMGTDSIGNAVKDEFLKHSQEEQSHADRLADRIAQLGGTANLNPEGMIDRSQVEFAADETLADMIEEDLIAERVAIQSYSEIIQYIGTKDPTTRRLLESILVVEQEHAEDLAGVRQEILRRERGMIAADANPLTSGELQ